MNHMDGGWRTGGGPTGRPDCQSIQEITVRSLHFSGVNRKKEMQTMLIIVSIEKTVKETAVAQQIAVEAAIVKMTQKAAN